MSDTPRSKEIMECVDEAINCTQRERMHAYKDAARCAVEQLEREVALCDALREHCVWLVGTADGFERIGDSKRAALMRERVEILLTALPRKDKP